MSVGALPYGEQAGREVSQRIAGYFASTTTLAALPAARRNTGMLAVVGSAGMYVFDEDATAGGVAPDAGSGRWIAVQASSQPLMGARFATAAALPTNTRTSNTLTADANGALNDTGIDGGTVAVGNVILVKNEVAGANNGVYVVTGIGSSVTKWTMVRVSELNSSAEMVPNLLVVVAEGTANADLGFVLTTNSPITINSTALTFTAAPSVSALASTAGAGLVGILDSGNFYAASTVEAALQEICTDLAAVTATNGASRIGIQDAAEIITGTTVETALAELAAVKTYIASKAFTFADLQEGDQDIDVAFAAALPAGAVVVGAGINVTAAFDNVGDSASVNATLGYAADKDGFRKTMALDAIAKVCGAVGDKMGGLVGAVTPLINVIPDVNGNTLTKGTAVAYVLYQLAF